MHSLGVVHKDLKPENIFLVNPGSPREEVRLLDSGLASLKANRASNITESGQVAGTARYMAPEYLKDHDLSPAIDVYQMGLILLEMLTGAPANHGTTMAQCLCIHSAARPHIPDDVKADPQKYEAFIKAQETLRHVLDDERRAVVALLRHRLIPFVYTTPVRLR